MTLRKPLTLIIDDTLVPFSTVLGTGPRHPPKMVNHSSKRPKIRGQRPGLFGSQSAEDSDTSTFAMREGVPTFDHDCVRPR